MAGIAGASTLLCWSSAAWIHRRPPAARWAHPLAAGLAAIVLINSWVQLVLLRLPEDSTNLILLAAGCGFFFLSTRWLAAVIALIWVIWCSVAATSEPSLAWRHFAFGLLSASVLSVLAHLARVRTLRNLETLRHALEARVAERTQELTAANESLRREIAERKHAEAARQAMQADLLIASRRAGMAEVATGVIHNVGNVLNSVNVSVTLIAEIVQASKVTNVARLAELLRSQAKDLGAFVQQDPRGQQLPSYLATLADYLRFEQTRMVDEIDCLRRNVDHIKQVIARQQGYARLTGVIERLPVADLVEEGLRMTEPALELDGIRLRRDYQPVGTIAVDRHKFLEILINLLQNARHALSHGQPASKEVTVRLRNQGNKWVQISVSDNGIGIGPDQLPHLFQHGFSTRADGHGFGLHSGAIAAQSMGGTLRAHSDGLGFGATFTLELPALPTETSAQPWPNSDAVAKIVT